MRCAEAHPQSWIRPKSLFIWGVGDNRTVDPGVSKLTQTRIKTEIRIRGGGADRTVDPGRCDLPTIHNINSKCNKNE